MRHRPDLSGRCGWSLRGGAACPSELGSGTGLVGLCAAFFGAAETVLTDTESHIPILEKNLEANAHLLSSSAGCCGAASPEPARVVVQEFDWSRSASHLGPAPFDVILGTDLAYAPELYDPLIQASSSPQGREALGKAHWYDRAVVTGLLSASWAGDGDHPGCDAQ